MDDNISYWQRAGIAEASGFRSLMFNAASQTLIAHMFRYGKDKTPFSDLYVRDRKVPNYSPLLAFEEGISFEYPVSSPFGPFLYALVLKACFQDGKCVGYDNVEVRKVDLLSRHEIVTLTAEQLKCPIPCHRVWVSTICGPGIREGFLYCSVGMQRKETDNHYPVDYKLCQVSVETGDFEIIADLSQTFI